MAMIVPGRLDGGPRLVRRRPGVPTALRFRDVLAAHDSLHHRQRERAEAVRGRGLARGGSVPSNLMPDRPATRNTRLEVSTAPRMREAASRVEPIPIRPSIVTVEPRASPIPTISPYCSVELMGP